MPTETDPLKKLQTLSINGKLEEMRNQAKNTIHIAGRMALSGQITVFYAGPNTGKTLITLKLIAEAIANGTPGRAVYHINLDDTFEGMITKGDLGNRHGFEVISPVTFSKPKENFAELVDFVIAEEIANESVFILDTIKKFTDVMDKKDSSSFMSTCRKLTSAGGSIIALAHTNKNKDGDNRAIPAGTSDVLDDCDCAYVMEIVDETSIESGTRRVVEFSQKKARGPAVTEAYYSYIRYEDADYERMFNSVKLVDGSEADRLREEKARRRELELDQDLILDITEILAGSSGMLQKELLVSLTDERAYPRRHVIQCLKRWSCSAEDGGLWTIKKGDKNSHRYVLN